MMSTFLSIYFRFFKTTLGREYGGKGSHCPMFLSEIEGLRWMHDWSHWTKGCVEVFVVIPCLQSVAKVVNGPPKNKKSRQILPKSRNLAHGNGVCRSHVCFSINSLNSSVSLSDFKMPVSASRRVSDLPFATRSGCKSIEFRHHIVNRYSHPWLITSKMSSSSLPPTLAIRFNNNNNFNHPVKSANTNVHFQFGLVANCEWLAAILIRWIIYFQGWKSPGLIRSGRKFSFVDAQFWLVPKISYCWQLPVNSF